MDEIREYFYSSFAFYWAYHRHPINRIIHCITIPLIVLTTIQIFSYLTLYDDRSVLLRANASLFIIVPYLILYYLFDYVAAIIWAIIICGSYLLCNWFYTFKYIWIITLCIFVLSWILQFMGHAIWEKRKPALMDSLIQAFLMAPLFVVEETLFELHLRNDLRCIIEMHVHLNIPN